MMFNVPQFIDIEDKIVGPFTAKQLGWLAAGGFILLILWNILTQGAFIIAAIIVGALVGALAFFRPYGQPLSQFLSSSILFLFHSKIYVWQRNYDNIKVLEKASSQTDGKEMSKHKKIDSEKIEKISVLLDENKSIAGNNFLSENNAISGNSRISRIVEGVLENQKKSGNEKKPMRISFGQDSGLAKSGIDLPEDPVIRFKP